VENFPGFPDGISGYELLSQMRRQAERFGARFFGGSATEIHADSGRKIVGCGSETFSCDGVVVATGSSPVPLAVPGEDTYGGGGGVSSCATCDGPFYKNKTVSVVGGGNSAAAEALFLSTICEKVYLIHRRDKLRATATTADKVLARKNVIALWNRRVVSIGGDGRRMDRLVICDVNGGDQCELACDGLFVSVGHRPNSDFARGFLEMDGDGYFVLSASDSSIGSVEGVFFGGDCCDRLNRQAIVAAGAGARAALSLERRLLRLLS
jgi:thioredoxin reductase (NADPH)